MELHPFLDLPAILGHLIEGHQDKIPWADALQILQALHEHIGQTVIFQHHIPVVADGDGRGNDPGAVKPLLFHAVHPCGDGRQRFPAALLPLEKAISLLQNTVDVLPLEVVELDYLFILHVPEGKFLQPCGDVRIFRHLTEGLALTVILPPPASEETLIAGKTSRLVVQHGLIDGDRLLLLRPYLPARFRAVCLVLELVVLFDQSDDVPRRPFVLPGQGATQIGQHLCLGQPRALPLLIIHIVRLLLGVETV